MEKNEVEAGVEKTSVAVGIALIDEEMLKSKIYTIRSVKVMLDADLAAIYGYSTKDFNRQVKNNIERFPEEFRFQLTKQEVENLRCNFSTANISTKSRSLPFVFTEHGIYMLMGVLKGELAIRQSIALVHLFKSMKDYIAAENQQLLGCANCAQIAALTAQNTREISLLRSDYEISKAATEEKLQTVMNCFNDPSTYKHFLILNGQKFEADLAYSQIYGMAKESLIVIDNYLNVKTLDLLRGVAPGVKVTILSDQYAGCCLTSQIKADFNAARPDIKPVVKPAQNRFHDRYIILDFDTANEKNVPLRSFQ